MYQNLDEIPGEILLSELCTGSINSIETVEFSDRTNGSGKLIRRYEHSGDTIDLVIREDGVCVGIANLNNGVESNLSLTRSGANGNCHVASSNKNMGIVNCNLLYFIDSSPQNPMLYKFVRLKNPNLNTTSEFIPLKKCQKTLLAI